MTSIVGESMLAGNSEKYTGPNTLHEVFEINLRSFGEKEGLLFDGKRITFSEINTHANRLARHLLSILPLNEKSDETNVTNAQSLEQEQCPKSIIAVDMNPSDHLIITLLAILKTGSAYMPVSSCDSRTAHLLNESKPACIIIDHENNVAGNDAIRKSNIPCLAYHTLSEQTNPEENLDNVSNKDSIACVLYTSGSTGEPKGVCLSHRSILNRLTWQWQTFPYKTDEVAAFKAPISFVDHISEIFAPLLVGVPLVVVPKGTARNPANLINLLEVRRVTRLLVVPTLLRNIFMFLKLTANSKRLRRVYLWVSSGEVLNTKLAREFFEYFPEGHMLCNFYGSTETMGDVTYSAFSSKSDVDSKTEQGMLSIGKPISNTIIYILDENKKLALAGEQGEIVVSGQNLAAGYLSKEHQNDGKEKFVLNSFNKEPMFARLFLTGDFGFVHNGNLIFCGRQDSIVKLSGHKFSMQEIQNALDTVDGVRESTVICLNDSTANQKLVAYYIPSPITNTTEDLVRKELARRLQQIMVPVIIEINKFPLLQNGKVDREKLEEIYINKKNAQSSHDTDVVTDTSDTSSINEENELLNIVCETMNIGKLKSYLSANFFDIGGHSSSALEVLIKLHEFGYTIPVDQFFKAVSLREIAQVMHAIKQDTRMSLNKMFDSTYRSKCQYIPLCDIKNRADLLNVISDSISKKEAMNSFAGVPSRVLYDFVNSVWDIAVKEGMSFAIQNPDGRIVGGSINFDFHQPPETMVIPATMAVSTMSVLTTMENRIRPQLKGKGRVLSNFLIATDVSLSYEENVQLAIMLESENVRKAEELGFDVALTINSHRITKLICRDILNYTVPFVYCYKDHEHSDGTKPYSHTPDDTNAWMMVKYLQKE